MRCLQFLFAPGVSMAGQDDMCRSRALSRAKTSVTELEHQIRLQPPPAEAFTIS